MTKNEKPYRVLDIEIDECGIKPGSKNSSVQQGNSFKTLDEAKNFAKSQKNKGVLLQVIVKGNDEIIEVHALTNCPS